MTEKLFYQDTYLRTFAATVLSCEEAAQGYYVRLDRTAFYPLGGGQPCDLGTLGSAAVTNVQEIDGEIFHFCNAPLCGTVEGEIDWARRFDLMQQHSGEHLVSGCVHNRYGLENVGFHMGADVITIDFNGVLSPQALAGIEREANEAIWANLKTDVFYPTREELCKLTYRSKKALDGAVRIVRFGSVDTCACCGTHVAHTGEIGLIKLLGSVKFREGIRVELLCGARAYDYLAKVNAQNHEISGLLSAKPLQTAASVQRVLQELADTKAACAAWEQKYFSALAAMHRADDNVLLFEENLTPDSLRRLCVALMDETDGVCAVFSDGKYAIGRKNADVRALVRCVNETLGGRGGGKPFFAQGSVTAAQPEIEAFFAARPELLR